MSFERVPPISLESEASIQQVYDYFEPRGPNAQLTGVVYPLLALILGPTRSFEPGAGERLTTHLDNGGKIFMPLKHKDALDPVEVAGATSRGPLSRMREGSDIMAKPGLFKNQPFALLISVLGAYVGIRRKDFNYEKFKAPADTKLRDELHDYTSRRAVELGIVRMNRNNHQGIFFEGERSQLPITPQRVKDGIGDILCGADNPKNFLLVCAAVDYSLGIFDASVAFSYPREIPETPEEIKQLVATDTQRCVETAAQISSQRRPNLKGQAMNRFFNLFLSDDIIYPGRET